MTLTLVLGYCGLRFSEAAALRRKSVGDRELTIRASAAAVTGQGIVESTTKTKRDRYVPVPGRCGIASKTGFPASPMYWFSPPGRVGIVRSVSIVGRSIRDAPG